MIPGQSHNCYVYVLFREDGRPFYVGKGAGRRWDYHEIEARRSPEKYNRHKHNIIRQMFANGRKEIPKVKVAEDLDEQTAMGCEIALIAAIGRHPNGPLVNLTDGGQGISGKKFSEEERSAISRRMKGKRTGPMSAEHRAKISAAHQGKSGFPHTPETRAKMSAARAGRKLSANHCASISAALTGKTKENSPWRAVAASKLDGIKRSDETRRKMSVARKALFAQREEALTTNHRS